MHDGYSNIEFVRIRDASIEHATIEAAEIFVDYVFTLWPFRKLYLQCNELTLPECKGLFGGLLRQEACLVEHEYYDDRFWDAYILALYREDREGDQTRVADRHESHVGRSVVGEGA